jgi:hypothetical protein
MRRSQAEQFIPKTRPEKQSWTQRLKTGTGFAGAKLSEILPCARVARFGQDDRND